MTHPVWLGISSGKLIDLAHPQTTDIDIEDIAWSLSNIMRFNGHLSTQISVARHSLEVSRLVPTELALAALLHDAHEAYVGDIVRPVKRYLVMHGVDLDEYEGVWQNLVWLRYDCLPTKAERQVIIEADDLQLAREITSLAPEGPFRDHGRGLLNKHAGHKMVTLLEMELCDANPRKDYVSFKKRFFELDGGKVSG
jgi:hypothetical protein